MWKEMEGQAVTYIGTFGARETHDTRLPTSPFGTWRSRATIFTRSSLKERTRFSGHGHSSIQYLLSAYCGKGTGPGTGQTHSLWDQPRLQPAAHITHGPRQRQGTA